MEQNRFIDSLNHPIPRRANSYMLSTYSIVLEAWRRGLKVSFRFITQAPGKIIASYSISDIDKVYHFTVTRGNLVSKEAVKSVINKVTTKNILEKNNIPTPGGKDFEAHVSDSEIINYASKLGYPVVIKPTDGQGGDGVIAGIQSEEELVEALEYVRRKLQSPQVILEKYFEGEDYRIYVIGNKVSAAYKRIKANVIGDGKSTVKQLINQKNIERAKLPSLPESSIKIDDEVNTLLHRKGYNLDSVIPEGEFIYIKSKNNISAGGESIDMTDKISDHIKETAINAASAFENLPQCGVDIMIDEENDTGVIIEINSRASIRQHLIPVKGQGKDVSSDIIDFYFPESINYDRKRAQKFYLDFDYIYDVCFNKKVKELQLPELPKQGLKLTRYLISNCNYTEAFAERVRQLAYLAGINGYIKPLNNGDISVVVGSSQKRINDFYARLKQHLKLRKKTAKLEEKERRSPIMHGFYIESLNEKNDNTDKNTLDKYIKDYAILESEYQNMVTRLAKYEQEEQTLELTKQQNKQLKKRLQQMEESNSWKFTKPIRALTGKKKK
ncbi:ATP-binding protein [Oceanobacillus locisalsi]|uniref:ATP-grasp domain-containing protein n=1 Tax=Oceanobacillus locisalsi TaxID=546107 RepID=A0ABW3NDJ9_9BACI